MLKKVTDIIINKDYKSVRNAYPSTCGKFHNDPDKKWIIDVDTNDIKEVNTLTQSIRMIEPEGNKVYKILDTPNGYHIICSPFNTQRFSLLHPGYDIHKNNPTILYVQN
jgi:hypothetical protein